MFFWTVAHNYLMKRHKRLSVVSAAEVASVDIYLFATENYIVSNILWNLLPVVNINHCAQHTAKHARLVGEKIYHVLYCRFIIYHVL